MNATAFLEPETIPTFIQRLREQRQEDREARAAGILYRVACGTIADPEATAALLSLGYAVDLTQPDRGPFYFGTDTIQKKIVKIEV